jgi:hypothetical protein
LNVALIARNFQQLKKLPHTSGMVHSTASARAPDLEKHVVYRPVDEVNDLAGAGDDPTLAEGGLTVAEGDLTPTEGSLTAAVGDPTPTEGSLTAAEGDPRQRKAVRRLRKAIRRQRKAV